MKMEEIMSVKEKIYPERKGFVSRERYEEYLEQMKSVRDYGHDAEDWHRAGDAILCEFLEEIGFGELAYEWKKLPKWYA